MRDFEFCWGCGSGARLDLPGGVQGRRIGAKIAGKRGEGARVVRLFEFCLKANTFETPNTTTSINQEI